MASDIGRIERLKREHARRSSRSREIVPGLMLVDSWTDPQFGRCELRGEGNEVVLVIAGNEIRGSAAKVLVRRLRVWRLAAMRRQE